MLWSWILLILAVQGSGAVSGSTGPALQDDDIKARIDSFVEHTMECIGIPGVSLAVVKDGQVFLSIDLVMFVDLISLPLIG